MHLPLVSQVAQLTGQFLQVPSESILSPLVQVQTPLDSATLVPLQVRQLFWFGPLQVPQLKWQLKQFPVEKSLKNPELQVQEPSAPSDELGLHDRQLFEAPLRQFWQVFEHCWQSPLKAKK